MLNCFIFLVQVIERTLRYQVSKRGRNFSTYISMGAALCPETYCIFVIKGFVGCVMMVIDYKSFLIELNLN